MGWVSSWWMVTRSVMVVVVRSAVHRPLRSRGIGEHLLKVWPGGIQRGPGDDVGGVDGGGPADVAGGDGFGGGGDRGGLRGIGHVPSMSNSGSIPGGVGGGLGMSRALARSTGSRTRQRARRQ